MIVDAAHRCPDFDSYRAARVKSLFNVDTGNAVDILAELPFEDLGDWSIGVIVGPSGSGKTTIGSRIFGPDAVWTGDDWPADKPIVDAIAPGGSFDAVVAALGAVGLGDVPAWLRPYPVLSNGERFRADLARVVAEAPARVVIDEFSSVVDRQIACIGAAAFAKSWRRTPGRAVLLSCHYDILEWLQPDWVYDTRDRCFRGRPGYTRPRIEVEIRRGGWQLWPYFEPHHYLKTGKMVAASTYVGFTDGLPVAHLGMSTAAVTLSGGRSAVEARGCRMVVLPEWQGAGVGMRFLNAVCELQRTGRGVIDGRRMTTLFHTSHPNLAAALRRDPRWRQVSAAMHGVNKNKSARSMTPTVEGLGGGYGGHLRATQGFRYVGAAS